MKSSQLKFEKPENWKIIKPEHYKEFSIINNETTPCEFGFAAKNKDAGFDVVSIFNYGKVGDEFIKELTSQLDNLSKNNSDVSEINNYINENAEGYAVSKTDFIKPIYYKKGKLFDKKVFINIMLIKTNINTSYSLQIFLEANDNLYCFATSSDKVEESKPFESMVKQNEHIYDLVNTLIKSI